MACAKQAEPIGFASILTIGSNAMPKGKKCHGKGKGKKRAGVAAASTGVGVQPYMPMKLPSSRDAHLKAIVVGLEATNAILPSTLCADPILPLAATVRCALRHSLALAHGTIPHCTAQHHTTGHCTTYTIYSPSSGGIYQLSLEWIH